MRARAISVLAVVVSGLLAVYSPAAVADGFTSAEFLQWPPKSRSSYFATSVTMASAVVRVNNKKQSACINAWYGNDRERVERRILDIMRKYPEYHPQSVILAVLEKQCGSVNNAGR